MKEARNEYRFSAVYAAKGDNDKALASVQTAFKRGFGDFAALRASPHFKHLRDDPRYQNLVEQYGNKECQNTLADGVSPVSMFAIPPRAQAGLECL